MYMLQSMNTTNAGMNSKVAIRLLKIMNAVPAIIIMHVSSNEINVLAFINVSLLFLVKIPIYYPVPFICGRPGY